MKPGDIVYYNEEERKKDPNILLSEDGPWLNVLFLHGSEIHRVNIPNLKSTKVIEDSANFLLRMIVKTKDEKLRSRLKRLLKDRL